MKKIAVGTLLSFLLVGVIWAQKTERIRILRPPAVATVETTAAVGFECFQGLSLLGVNGHSVSMQTLSGADLCLVPSGVPFFNANSIQIPDGDTLLITIDPPTTGFQIYATNGAAVLECGPAANRWPNVDSPQFAHPAVQMDQQFSTCFASGASIWDLVAVR